MRSHIITAAFALATLSFASNSNADFMFSEDFSSPTLNPNLEYTNGFTGYNIAGGTIGNLSNLQREYVRTIDSDYSNFRYEITLNHNNFVGNDIAFVGVGSGTPDLSFSNEPGLGSLMFRFHNPALVGGRVDIAFWEAGNVYADVDLGSITAINQPARVSIERIGDTLTMGYDINYGGVYTPDVIRSFDLNDPSFAAIKAALDSESRLFFGSTFGTVFDDFVVTNPVPEPGYGLLAIGMAASMLWRRRS